MEASLSPALPRRRQAPAPPVPPLVPVPWPSPACSLCPCLLQVAAGTVPVTPPVPEALFQPLALALLISGLLAR